MKKYYKVLKDTFIWKEGAILENTANGSTGNGYHPITDIWNKFENQNEYISVKYIENELNSEWFERVYPDTIKGNIYRTKDQMIELYKTAFK